VPSIERVKGAPRVEQEFRKNTRTSQGEEQMLEKKKKTNKKKNNGDFCVKEVPTRRVRKLVGHLRNLKCKQLGKGGRQEKNKL